MSSSSSSKKSRARQWKLQRSRDLRAKHGDSKLPLGPIATKAVSLRELKFAPIQEFKMWCPGRFVTISSSAGSVVNTVAIINDITEGTYGSTNVSNLAAVFQQSCLLHTRITIIPQMETGTNQQAMIAVGVDTESATAYADKNEASSGNTFMMPLSSAAQSCVQFTVYQRSYDELIWIVPTTTTPTGQRMYLKLYGDSTTGLAASKQIVQLKLEFFVAFRGLKQV
jgi:hypothetical protein